MGGPVDLPMVPLTQTSKVSCTVQIRWPNSM